VRLASVTSTNDEAKRLAGEGATHGTVITADTQTAGRGRRGRVWASPAGNLYLSIVLRPVFPPSEAPPLAPAIGLAIARAIEEVAPVTARVKWPNDVQVGGKKVAGVLAESVVSGSTLEAVIVGIGVNVGTELPPELAEIATTLSRESGRNVRKSDVEEAIYASIYPVYGAFVLGGFAALAKDWAARDALLGREVKISSGGGTVEGRAEGIARDGSYRVRTKDGVVNVTAGEVL
jgi:BirA family biotin operon repressor/biotin-[acetyl-CoA-carboxylase] ligase